MYAVLADLVLSLHVLIVIFVVFGLCAILLGRPFGWSWVRNPILRVIHLVSIGIVMMQAWAGVVCPLTTLEMCLRQLAGQTTYKGSFITHWLSALIYYDLPAWVFTLAYTLFAMLVLFSWYWVRPRSFTSKHR